MPAATTNASSVPTTPKRVLTAIHNIPKRMRSGTLRTQPPRPRAPGKENVPPSEESARNGTTRSQAPRPRRRPAPLLPRSPPRVPGLSLGSHAASPDQDVFSDPLTTQTEGRETWATKDGRIVIKVWVPTTGDIWKLRVPEDVGLERFRARVAAKVGFEVSFSAVMYGTLKTVGDEETFKEWIGGRVQHERNSLLTAHRLVPQ